MAVEILQNVHYSMKLSVYRFLGSLNLNLSSNLKNSKWQIQYGGENFENCSELDEIVRV